MDEMGRREMLVATSFFCMELPRALGLGGRGDSRMTMRSTFRFLNGNARAIATSRLISGPYHPTRSRAKRSSRYSSPPNLLEEFRSGSRDESHRVKISTIATFLGYRF